MITTTVMSTDNDEVTVTFKQDDAEVTTVMSKFDYFEYVSPTIMGRLKAAWRALFK